MLNRGRSKETVTYLMNDRDAGIKVFSKKHGDEEGAQQYDCMIMGENLAYGLRGVEVKEVSHGTTNAIKHNPYAQIVTVNVMQKKTRCKFFLQNGIFINCNEQQNFDLRPG